MKIEWLNPEGTKARLSFRSPPFIGRLYETFVELQRPTKQTTLASIPANSYWVYSDSMVSVEGDYTMDDGWDTIIRGDLQRRLHRHRIKLLEDQAYSAAEPDRTKAKDKERKRIEARAEAWKPVKTIPSARLIKDDK